MDWEQTRQGTQNPAKIVTTIKRRRIGLRTLMTYRSMAAFGNPITALTQGSIA